jgi:hypothetical protein
MSWLPDGILALAISKLEGQMEGNALTEYGTDEHLAVLRYATELCCEQRKNAEGKVEFVLDQDKLRRELERESGFYSIASNANKKLIAAKLVPEGKKARAKKYI